MKLDIQYLAGKIEEFNAKYGRMPYGLSELTTSGLIDTIPPEPHEGQYYITGHEVRSTWEDERASQKD